MSRRLPTSPPLRWCLLPLLALLALAGCSPVTSPTASSPGVQPISTADPLSEAGGIAPGARGTVWFDASACGCLEQVTPSGLTRQVQLGLESAPRAIAAAPGGALWVATAGALQRLAPDGTIRRYPLEIPEPAGPNQIVVAADGTVWFASGDGVGRLLPGGRVDRFTKGFVAQGSPRQLAIDPAGGVWFAGGTAGVGHLGASGQASYRSVAVGTLGGVQLVAAAGATVWFVQQDDSDQVHRLTPQGAQTVPIAVPPDDVQVQGLTTAADGTLWFTGRRFATTEDEELVGSISGGGVRTFPIAETGTGLGPIVVAGDGTLWFVERDGGVARMTPEGGLQRFDAPPPLASIPAGMAAGPDGNVWVSEPKANQLVRITAQGGVAAVRDSPIPNSGPTSITAGPDGALWAIQPAAESSPNRIGEPGLVRTTPSGAVSTYPYPATGADLAGSSRPGTELWFTQTYGSPFLGRVGAGGQIQNVPYTDAIPSHLAVDPSDDLWGAVGTRIARVTPSGTERSWDVGALPQSLCWANGALWFAAGAGGIGRLSSDGRLRRYPAPGATDVQTLAIGAGGAVWFTGVPDNLLGRLLPDGQLSWYALSAVAETPAPTPSATLSTAPANPSDPAGDGIQRQLLSGSGGYLWLTRSDEPVVERIDPGALPPANPAPGPPVWPLPLGMVAIAIAATGAEMLWRRRSARAPGRRA